MQCLSEEDRSVLSQALAILDRRIPGTSYLTNPEDVRDYIRLSLGPEFNEHFAMLFLDSAHRILCFKRLFQGTIDSAAVYPRVIVQQALACNAASAIAVHNHPSGIVEPSQADRILTSKIKDALSLIDVRLLDHFVVGSSEIFSFAENGLL
ncbi:RadC family protein [Pseudomonas aeruginosa]|uniref:RadC family protein n=1 Tax=Pseudomonas aeruginosa TaxID=287 RepID=UPI00136A2D7E|nr:DNA repair protein RadC [Pseudomonas aeruginosa]MYM52953.1 DNA repair protein RadC [Pseudomonas aeruginosa]